MIYLDHLTKAYRSVTAVDRVSFEVPSGSVFGLLGPNGAGKTTALKMLLGMTRPTSGTATVGGHDITMASVAVRSTAAFIPEDKVLYDSMTAGQFLRLYGSFFPDWSDDIAQRFLHEWNLPASQKLSRYSKGMKSKLHLACVLARRPKVLFLDEPTEGLDPAGLEDVLQAVTYWVSSKDRCAVVATHRLEEVERICDRIGILHQGRLLLTGNLDDLKSSWKCIELAGEFPVGRPEEWPEVHSVQREQNFVRVIVRSAPQNVEQRLRDLGVRDIQVHDMSLREIYLACTGKGGLQHGVHETLA